MFYIPLIGGSREFFSAIGMSNNLVVKIHYRLDREVAKKQVLAIDESVISEEEKYDGFYGVCTNLGSDLHQ